jgi:ribosomal protein L11 methylase PrmA
VLIRSAARLLDLLRPAGVLIVSGLLDEERDDVVRAFGDATGHVGRVLLDPPLIWEEHEDGWVALAMKRS